MKHRLGILKEDGGGEILLVSRVVFHLFREVGWKVVDTFDTHISGQDGNTGFFLFFVYNKSLLLEI
jgi:predicted rRNA methylase YqxC with S4 and FtsJ domains